MLSSFPAVQRSEYRFTPLANLAEMSGCVFRPTHQEDGLSLQPPMLPPALLKMHLYGSLLGLVPFPIREWRDGSLVWRHVIESVGRDTGQQVLICVA